MSKNYYRTKVNLVILRMLIGKKHPKIKLQRLQKI